MATYFRITQITNASFEIRPNYTLYQGHETRMPKGLKLQFKTEIKRNEYIQRKKIQRDIR